MNWYFFKKKHTETFNEQTKSRPQETLEFKLKWKNFPFSPPINLSDEKNWFLAVTSFEATKSAVKITNENNSFSNTTPGCLSSRGGLETINELGGILRHRAQGDIQLHV